MPASATDCSSSSSAGAIPPAIGGYASIQPIECAHYTGGDGGMAPSKGTGTITVPRHPLQAASRHSSETYCSSASTGCHPRYKGILIVSANTAPIRRFHVHACGGETGKSAPAVEQSVAMAAALPGASAMAVSAPPASPPGSAAPPPGDGPAAPLAGREAAAAAAVSAVSMSIAAAPGQQDHLTWLT